MADGVDDRYGFRTEIDLSYPDGYRTTRVCISLSRPSAKDGVLHTDPSLGIAKPSPLVCYPLIHVREYRTEYGRVRDWPR